MMEQTHLRMSSTVEVLDPLIKKLIKGCSLETALNLKEVLPSVDAQALQKLHTFILVPLLGEISNEKLSKEVKTILLDCVHEVLTNIRLANVSILKNVLTMLMIEIFDKNTPTMIKNVPEEMKLSTINCALAAVKNMPHDIQDKFYVKENIPFICQISYTCLQLAETETFKILRIRAMEVVIALQQMPLFKPDQRSPWERQEIADIFQYILPGATSKLISIVSGDITQGSKVLSIAIFTLSSMISLVMEDYKTCNTEDIPGLVATLKEMSKNHVKDGDVVSPMEPASRDVEGMKKLIDSSKGRTPEWRKKIAAHLAPYLIKIAAQFEHSNTKVCKAVAQSCFLIILRCSISLREALSPLLDALVALSVHEDVEVRQESISLIFQLTDYFSDHNDYDFIQLAEENFYMLLTRLPRFVQEEGGTRGAASIALLSGYVQLLRSSMRNVLSSSAHLQRLTLSLLHVITLECSGISVSREHSMRQLEAERYDDFNVPWIQLRFNSDKAVLSNVQQFCEIISEKSLGIYDDFCSQLVDTLYSVPQFKKEAIILLNMLVLSGFKAGNDTAQQLSMSLLETYLIPEFWPSKENNMNVTTISKLQQDITTVCLLTEGIGCCVYGLGRDKAQTQLLRILYPLLEQAGSANSCISLAGRRALTRVSIACGHESNITELISKNMDYLSHCMSVEIRRSNEQMSVFDALNLVLHHSSPEIALGLYNIVLNVLQQSSDTTKSTNNEAHLRVFLTFANGVRHWLNPTRSGPISCNFSSDLLKEDSNEGSSVNLDLPSVGIHLECVKWNAVENLKIYQQNIKHELMDTVEEEPSPLPNVDFPSEMQLHNFSPEIRECGETSDTAMQNNEDKKEVPELAKLLVLVLKRCLHFLPSQNIQHQFLAIRTLEVGVLALEPYTDTLLPIIHQIWSPLVGRFKADQPPLIIRTAFHLLTTMAHSAKDFLLSRTIREVLPQFTNFLKSSVVESHLKDHGSAYRFSQKFKAQLSLLSGLGVLACNLKFRGQDFYPLLSVSLLYLSCYQPRPLQTASVSLIHSLNQLDADAVWWALVTWWTPSHLAPVLKLPYPSSHQDCEENVKLLLSM